MDKTEENKKSLMDLTSKKQVIFTESGDHAIILVLQHLFSKGYKKALIQNQGGWFSYLKYPKKAGFEAIELKTDYGLIDLDDLKQKAAADCVLLANSLTGYFAEQDMNHIYEICKEKKCFVANDVSGSIGRDIAKIGDLALGSFGEHKPIEIGQGGFIAYNENFNFKDETDFQLNQEELAKQLAVLHNKISFFESIRNKIINDLNKFEIIHKNKNGINVVVKYKSDEEKEKITDYCKSNNFEYVLCPNYIKVNEKAVSIEIKRQKFY